MRPKSESDLISFQLELQKATGQFKYNFSVTQKDRLDKLTDDLVYNALNYSQLTTSEVFKSLSDLERNYATARWFNYMSSIGVEAAIVMALGAKANVNKYDKLVDFELYGYTYDHKTSVSPSAISENIEYYLDNPIALAKWLYMNQSHGSRREAINNRFFIVCHSYSGSHWKLKADVYEIYKLLKNNADAIFDSMFDLNVNGITINSNVICYCK